MRTVINGLLALVVSAVMIVCHRLLLPIVGNNWNLWGLLAVIYFIVAPVIVMIYFQFIDGYVRRWEWEREQEK